VNKELKFMEAFRRN